jgi:hypothetical protein
MTQTAEPLAAASGGHPEVDSPPEASRGTELAGDAQYQRRYAGQPTGV